MKILRRSIIFSDFACNLSQFAILILHIAMEIQPRGTTIAGEMWKPAARQLNADGF
jgi:hypothetical protein